jgi:hypothetical protein
MKAVDLQPAAAFEYPPLDYTSVDNFPDRDAQANGAPSATGASIWCIGPIAIASPTA